MNYSTNYNLNKPERNEQFNLDDWNNNTDAIDTAMNTNKTNIANNASNISTILTGLSTINTSDTNSVYYKLMKLIYPVGSLYWSSKSTNPASLFGGTWVQIKDRFVLACGDTYNTTGATGGASTVTLSVSNMPSHNHSFSWKGSHTHSITDSGHSHTGRTSTDGNHRHYFNYDPVTTSGGAGAVLNRGSSVQWTNYAGDHNHSFTTDRANTGISIDSETISISGNTSTSGSGTAFSILPPYVVKYCWERTA